MSRIVIHNYLPKRKARDSVTSELANMRQQLQDATEKGDTARVLTLKEDIKKAEAKLYGQTSMANAQELNAKVPQ